MVMKKKSLFITLITLILTLSMVVLAGCSGTTDNTKTEKWTSISDVLKQSDIDGYEKEIVIQKLYTYFSGTNDDVKDDISFYQNDFKNIERDLLSNNFVEFNTYTDFSFFFNKKESFLKFKFEVVAENDGRFEFEIKVGDKQTYEDTFIQKEIDLTANQPKEIVINASELEKITDICSIDIYLTNLPTQPDLMNNPVRKNMNIKWKIQNICVVCK